MNSSEDREKKRIDDNLGEQAGQFAAYVGGEMNEAS